MAVGEYVLRAQELDGRWTPIGATRAVGIVAEGLVATVDDHGPKDLTGTLKRDPSRVWPDLVQWTPLELEVEGVVVWSGRVKETPTTSEDGYEMALSGEGGQFELDDDLIKYTFVHSDLTEWRDARTYPHAQLGVNEFSASGQVSNDETGITLMLPNSIPIISGSRVGVVLDLGEENWIAGAEIQYESSANTVNDLLYARGQHTPYFASPDVLSGYNDMLAGRPTNTAPFKGTLFVDHGGLAFRYLVIFNYTNASYTPGADVWWRLRAIRVGTLGGSSGPSWANAGNSPLASEVVGVARTLGSRRISLDGSLIAGTSFQLPSFHMTKYGTARSMIEAANTYHGNQWRVRADQRIEFRPYPTAPLFIAGESAGFAEASANSGQDIYTDVVVEAPRADGGGTVRYRRSQPAQFPLTLAAPQPTNPDLNTPATLAGWFASGTTNTRFASSSPNFPGVGMVLSEVNQTTVGGYIATNIGGNAGVWESGARYRLTFDYVTFQNTPLLDLADQWRIVITAPTSTPRPYPTPGNVNLGDQMVAQSQLPNTVGAWASGYVDFTYPRIPTGFPVWAYFFSAGGKAGAADIRQLYLTGLRVWKAAPNVASKQSVRRAFALTLNTPMTDQAAVLMADAWLANHRTQPLRGSLNVRDSDTIIRVGGERVRPHELLLHAGELVRLPLVDRDTGGIGREGRITGVSLDVSSGVAGVEIGSDPGNVEAFLARLAVVSGGNAAGS